MFAMEGTLVNSAPNTPFKKFVRRNTDPGRIGYKPTPTMIKEISTGCIHKSITPKMVQKPDDLTKNALPFGKATPQSPSQVPKMMQPNAFRPIPHVPALELQKFLMNHVPSSTQIHTMQNTPRRNDPS